MHVSNQNDMADIFPTAVCRKRRQIEWMPKIGLLRILCSGVGMMPVTVAPAFRAALAKLPMSPKEPPPIEKKMIQQCETMQLFAYHISGTCHWLLLPCRALQWSVEEILIIFTVKWCVFSFFYQWQQLCRQGCCRLNFRKTHRRLFCCYCWPCQLTLGLLLLLLRHHFECASTNWKFSY